MIIFLLTIASVHDVSSQNLYAVTTTVDIGTTDGDKVTDYSWLQPLNTTTSVYQDTTITDYLPTSTTVLAEEILNSSETNVRNRYAWPFGQHHEHGENDSPEEPADHAIPYSEYEEARDVPTQPKYLAPGTWAKPPPEKNIPLDFVPTKLHAQVRGKHTVKRLPQRHAIESAASDEERRNAHRLREVVTNSKVNTVYTEEGYEDSAYDHAGHVRDADFHEGFARKLHDQKKSEHDFSSGKKRGEDKSLVPDEFEEYEEDYEDHLQENGKDADDENNLIENRDSWEESEINPKFVAQNNIQKLEEDIEKDAEEAERDSKVYQNAQESKLRNDIRDDSSELEEPHVDEDSKHENKSVKTKKKKKSKSRNGKNDNASKGTKRKSKRRKKLHPENYETTVLPLQEASSADAKTPASPHGFVTSPPQIYSIDQTTLRYVAPITMASFEPTTASYSQLFWDYFKERQGPSTTEPSTFASNSTTMNPQQEAQTPIAVATIDGHGPYLLVTKEETVTSPSTFLDPRSFRPRNLFGDHVEFGPTSAQTQGRHLLGQSDGVDYVNNVITASTVATLNPEGVEYSSSTLLDTTVSSSTPTVMTINFTQEAYARIADYHENPFLGPVLGNSNIAVAKNKLKYKVLARAKPDKKPVKSVAQSPPQQVPPSKEEKGHKRIRDELNVKYNKMLSYIKSKQETQFPKEKKILFPEDFTLRRPPVQRAAYSIFLTDHPSINRSSESASSREVKERRSEMKNQHQLIKLPYFGPFAQPAHPIYRKNVIPTTKLLPPPLPLASNYANYRGGKQNDNHHSHPAGKSQQRRDNPYRYFPLNPEASRRTRARRKRSDEGEFRDGGGNATDVDVKAAANNGVTNDNKSEQRDKSSFDRVIDRSEGKLSSRRVIDVPIDVPDAKKFESPTKSSADESGTSRNKNSAGANGEREDVGDARKMIIGVARVDKKRPVSSRTAEQNRRVNDTDAVELAKRKRDVESETYFMRNSRNKVNDKNHEELLNESPRISGDVVDKEIAVRFNEKDDEPSPETQNDGRVEIEVPSFDYVDEIIEDDLIKFSTTTEAALDLKKYPFYNNENVPSASALKYVVDPEIVPRKTSRGMEFYDSRNAYKQCDEVEPELGKVLPEKEEPDPERGPQEDLPRLRGLGDKLDCFKAKYFDENPLDSPLFAEKLVEEPTPPLELNPTQFASKIMVLPEENDEYVVPQVSKKPERSGRQWRSRNRPYETLESIRVNYKHDPQTGRGRNAYFHTVRGTRPSNTMRRTKNRKSRPKVSTTTPSPKLYQTASYQNLVYEDVMGNIRNMKNTYQVYEMTTLPPSKPILIAAAGSENTLKVADTAKEKSTSKPDVIDLADVTDVTNKTKSSEIRGLVPPPKYLIYRQNYRKHRPPAKSRGFIRPPSLPQIIAHHHTTKLNKRSTTDDRDSSESTINESKKSTINGSVEIDAVGNDTSIVKLIGKAMNETNVTSEPLDLEIEESRPISIQDRNLSTVLKINDKKKRRNYTSGDLKSEPQKIVYTIRDRIRYSKPKWDARGVGKFAATSRTVDEDSRRKEPRYNRVERKKSERQNNPAIINSEEDTSGIESATSLIDDRESSTTEVYHAEESAVQQMIYHKKDEYPEVEKAENINLNAEFKESLFDGDEEESTTNMYQVRENVDENASTTATNLPREVLDLREYLKSDPPGYAEAFFDEATTPSSNYHATVNHESEDSEEKQEEETDYPRNLWDNDSFEKIEEQVETPMKMELNSQDDDSEEFSSKEEQGSSKDETFFTYMKRPLSTEGDKDGEHSEKATARKPFPFSRYKSKLNKESEENDREKESEEKSEDYVFPWHADKEDKYDKRRWLFDLDRYEYPWERRARLAEERKRWKQGRARFYDDDDENEEESVRYERPVYPWEKYNVPSKIHRVNTRRGISRRYIDDSEESSTEYVPRYSSRYSSSGAKPTKFSNAREISRSIKRFLEEDDGESEGRASKEIENRSPSFGQKSSERGISRGTLVPEDVTQPPRRRNVRRKISQVNRNGTSGSRFDSKKLGSKGVNEGKEEEQHLKLNQSDLDDPESPAEVTSQLSDETKTATEQRKKRRRKTSRNNLAVSLDNASAETATKPSRKRRRRPEASTTTSATPLASVDLGPRKSFPPVRKRNSKKDDRLDLSDKTASTRIATPKIIKADDFQVEASTPKTRTVEHRSRVSKEKIVTKTSYPNETESFDPMKTSRMSARREPVRLRIKTRRGKNNNKPDEDSDNKRELIQQEDNEGNHEVKFDDGDGIKKSVVPDKPRDKSGDNTFRHLGMKREELKKINDFGAYDGVVNDENDNNNGGFGTSSEVSLSPHHRTAQLTEYGIGHMMSSMSWYSKNYDY